VRNVTPDDHFSATLEHSSGISVWTTLTLSGRLLNLGPRSRISGSPIGRVNGLGSRESDGRRSWTSTSLLHHLRSSAFPTRREYIGARCGRMETGIQRALVWYDGPKEWDLIHYGCLNSGVQGQHAHVPSDARRARPIYRDRGGSRLNSDW
jgi:hypothetical protein